MKNPFSHSSKKFGFFGKSRAVRLSVYAPILLLMFFFWVRLLEWKMTHHPGGYSGGAEWVLPKKTEEVFFTTADGVKLNGWFLHSRRDATSGTVLYCHGNGGNLTNVREVAENLAERGLAVLIYDYRGYGRSEGSTPIESELYADADAAYDYLTKNRNVKPENLAIYGLSLGTTAATDLASRQDCGALVLEAPLSSASDMASYAVPILPRWAHWIGRNRFESAQKISRVKCPILIAHGDADSVIPVEQGRKVFAAASEPKKLLIIPNGSHWLPSVNGYVDQVADFIINSLPHTNDNRSS